MKIKSLVLRSICVGFTVGGMAIFLHSEIDKPVQYSFNNYNKKGTSESLDYNPENMYIESVDKYDGYYLDGDRLVAVKSPIEGLNYMSKSKIVLNGVTYLAPDDYVLRIEDDCNVSAVLKEYAELEDQGAIVTYDSPNYPGYTTIEVNGEPIKAINNYKTSPIVEETKEKIKTMKK